MNFKHRFNHKDQGGFPMPHKDIEYLFEHGQVINYTLDDVSIHPVTTKDTGVLPNSVAGEEGNC